MLVLVLILILVLFFLMKKKKETFSIVYSYNIIQTWKDNAIPIKYKSLIHSVKKNNPKANYMFFTDYDIKNFMKEKFPQYLNTFYSLPFTIQKIDFFRYLAIYYYGGIYLDLDMKIHRNLEDLSHSYKCIFPLEFQQNTDSLLQQQNFKGLIGNYAFYAPKNHPFLLKIINNIHQSRIPMTLTEKNRSKYIFYTTGPVMVTQSYLDYKQKEDIKIIYPEPFKKSSFGIYGSHISFKSWVK